jgi:hypothetical protein
MTPEPLRFICGDWKGSHSYVGDYLSDAHPFWVRLSILGAVSASSWASIGSNALTTLNVFSYPYSLCYGRPVVIPHHLAHFWPCNRCNRLLALMYSVCAACAIFHKQQRAFDQLVIMPFVGLVGHSEGELSVYERC